MVEEKIEIKKEWFIQARKGPIDEYYQTTSKKTLGAGTYGSVIKVKVKGTKNTFRAIKIIPKSKVKDPQRFKNEIDIMKTLDHPNIIKLYENFEDARNVYLVMEVCEGGELFDRIIDKGHFTEKEARDVFTQISYALAHCHAVGICHRDLKPENFLLLDKSENMRIKVIDFGLSMIFNSKQTEAQKIQQKVEMKTKAGTPYYISPEVLEGKYDQSCDIWSLGVILFILLSGLPPFYGKNDAEILKMVKNRSYSFDIPEFENISPEAKELITKCFQIPEKRLTASQILDHPWMKKDIPKNTQQINMNQLASFNSHTKLKKVALTYIASQCSENEIMELGNLFKKLDKNNDGVLTIDEIKENLSHLNSDQIKDLAGILDSIDTDGSGTIAYTEFIAASLDKSVYLKEEKVFQAFKMFDLDNSGKISRGELKQVLGQQDDFQGKSEAFWDSLIKEADKNGDGEIDYNEFTDMMKNMGGLLTQQ